MQRQQTEGASSGVTRRAFLGASIVAAGSASATVAGSTGAADAATDARSGAATAQATTYRFGGRVQAWQGRAPQSIAGQENPTLQLEAGRQYRFVWENLDGQPHNVALYDADGNTIASTEIVQEEGATQTLSFTATPAMASYICEVHPTTMVGDVQVAGGGGEAGDGGQGDGASVPITTYFFAGAVLLAFVSPILFALVLLFVGTGDSFGTDGAGRSNE